jgi:hypothetical protein
LIRVDRDHHRGREQDGGRDSAEYPAKPSECAMINHGPFPLSAPLVVLAEHLVHLLEQNGKRGSVAAAAHR